MKYLDLLLRILSIVFNTVITMAITMLIWHLLKYEPSAVTFNLTLFGFLAYSVYQEYKERGKFFNKD